MSESREPQAALRARFTRNVLVFEFWQLSLGFFLLDSNDSVGSLIYFRAVLEPIKQYLVMKLFLPLGLN